MKDRVRNDTFHRKPRTNPQIVPMNYKIEAMSQPILVPVFQMNPKSRTVLVVGDADSGKSTFVNTIANYFKGGCLDSLRIAVSTEYFHSTEGSSRHNGTGSGVSRIYDCCPRYEFFRDGMQFNFIGPHDSVLSLQKMLTAAHEAADLHAILLVIDGSKTCLSPAIPDIFVQLRGNLPDSTLENVIVVLTRCRQDTTAFKLSLLKDIVPNLKKESVFYMDNTAFVSKPNKNGRLVQSPVLVAEWNTSMKECAKIAERIKGFSTVATEDFAKMRKNRFELKRILNNVKLEVTNLQDTLEQLSEAEQRQKQQANDQENFKNFTQTTRNKVTKQETTSYHNTLQGGDRCRVCPKDGSYTEHYHAKQIFVEVEETLETILQDIKDKYDEAVQQYGTVDMQINILVNAKAAVNAAMQHRVDELRGVCDDMKKICSGFNFADELRVTLNQLKVEQKQLRSVEAQDSALQVIRVLEGIINHYSKDNRRSGPGSQGTVYTDLDGRDKTQRA